jgi:probable phosphomutase (TIGR03848 family)
VTTFLFLRHGISDANEKGVLAGRLPDINLSTKGREQARQLVKHIEDLQVHRILVSPLDRCLQTVEPYLASSGKRFYFEKSFIEMNYGDWSGQKLKELSKTKDWKKVQSKPSEFVFPNGESFRNAQRRVLQQMNALAEKNPKKNILIVSHGDIIKLAICASLSMKLDDFQRIVVDPASITAINWEDNSKTLLYANRTPTKSRKKSRDSKSKNLKQRRVLGGGRGE